MVTNGVVANKVQVIRETVGELRKLQDLTVDRLESDFFLKRGVERSLQICVEAVIDIAHRLVSLLGDPPCPSGGAALDVLASHAVIRDAATYKKMVQFRNLVVHRYDTIDNAMLAEIVRNHLADFDRFIAEIADARIGS